MKEKKKRKKMKGEKSTFTTNFLSKPTTTFALFTNVQLKYSKFTDFFAIEPSNGRIRVNKSLLRNSGTYVFRVMARDEGGVGPYNSTAKVTIIVLEATNSPPEWTIPPVDNMTITVLEVGYNHSSKNSF
jgi:hypothetical protein